MRQRSEGYYILYADYFTDDPLHDEVVFQRHFRMNRNLFLDIFYAFRSFDNYFICKTDCTGIVGFSLLQKCNVALRMLAYGASGDAHDDYICIAKSTIMECMYRFCRVVVVFASDYMRTPNEED
jgi:hypothetical protein